jgi:2-dehydro-3-deoxyphosphogluconate aldolase/(4S)-4-hydroxy-2-oxoglutarate aldolase
MNLDTLLRACPVMPVIVLERAEDAVPLAKALIRGGVTTLEVTLRTPVALESIRSIREACPEAVVGAGTVTSPETLLQAAQAGAAFAVSPGLTDALAHAAARGFPLLPGVMTPSEVMRARSLGFTHLKLFPAEQAGGLGMLKALASPFPEVRFCPTGGLTPESAPAYLAQPNVVCVGGSWLTPRDLVARQDWDALTRLAEAATALRPRS